MEYVLLKYFIIIKFQSKGELIADEKLVFKPKLFLRRGVTVLTGHVTVYLREWFHAIIKINRADMNYFAKLFHLSTV